MSTVKSPQGERKTSGARPKGRAERVVTSVLQATGERLDEVGYAALRVEDVAELAGVNKTTIYRRWPTKAVLVVETLRSHFMQRRPAPSTGNLRDDLLVYLDGMATASETPLWRGMFGALTSRTEPEVEEVAKELRQREREYRLKLIQRGIDRGELPKSADPELVADMVSAPVLRHIQVYRDSVSRDYIEKVIDVALAGAAVVALRDRS